ncbi:MAG: hypothetical protein ACXVXL_30595, partial [Solirubrobacteraceae bacterium]
RVAWRLAAALTVMAGAAVAPPVAGADTARTVVLHRGVTGVNLTVPHVSGARPPAILLSLTRAGGPCSVPRYSYVDHERRGRFRMWIRCPRARRGARVKLVFRAPLQRRFRLRNGVGTVRVVIDKPRGTALPMAALRTRPADRDCRITRSRVFTAPRRLTATARVQCRGLPVNAHGVLMVGGLLAADAPADPSRSSEMGRSAATAAAASISQGCEAPLRLTVGGDAVQWKQCFTGPFSLGPWQSQWVGHIGSTPQFHCEAGWVRRFGALDHPVLWALIGRFDVDLATDPRDAWAWSWRLGVVSNWQFTGDITFWWTYRCFQFNPPGPR